MTTETEPHTFTVFDAIADLHARLDQLPPPILCTSCAVEHAAGRRETPNAAFVVEQGRGHCAEHIQFVDGPVLPGQTPGGLYVPGVPA